MSEKKIQHTGIMNKMRDKMPLIIIILIIAFLATIVFEWGMNYMGLSGKNEAFAKINSKEITYQEYEKVVSQQVEQMRQQNQGKDIDEATMNQIREQVWNSLVSQAISQQAIEKYGIKVSDKEILDRIYNRPESLPEPIKRNFIDSTGVFNSAFYQQALGMKTKEATQFWGQVENYLRETMLSEKLQAVLTEGAVVSEGDVLDKYKDDNIIANFNYALLDLNTVTDTNQFAVTDNDLKEYYEKNKNDFKQVESISLKYILFPEVSTAEDSAALLKEMEVMKKEMIKSNVEDSSLIKLIADNSTIPFNPEFQPSSSINSAISPFLFSAKPGDVSDVIITTDGYQVVKLLDEKDGTDILVNASHVLINFGNDTAAAQTKALDIYNRVKKGEDIKTLASELSDDPSAKQNRGDLGWFKKGAMVKEFEDAAFNANVGDVVGPVKTKYGFHVIKVLGKEKKEFKVAQINKTVTPSGRTKQIIKKKAEDFYSELKKGQNMDSLAKQMNMTIQYSKDLSKDMPIPLAINNKKIGKMLFDNKVNYFTEPVKVTGGYSVYDITDKKAEGFLNFDSIKVNLIKPKVVNEKKFQILSGIANDLQGKIQNGDLNSLKEIAPQYSYEVVDSFKVSSPNPKIGVDYVLTSAIMKMNPGDISKPIKGVKGYYLIKLNSKTDFNEQDYIAKAPEIRKNLLTAKKQAIVSEWLAKMQNDAEIVDNRDRYF
ncbi:MAG: peptidylprolyl isomerase [bacterium]